MAKYKYGICTLQEEPKFHNRRQGQLAFCQECNLHRVHPVEFSGQIGYYGHQCNEKDHQFCQGQIITCREATQAEIVAAKLRGEL